jgi:hypothetical protein
VAKGMGVAKGIEAANATRRALREGVIHQLTHDANNRSPRRA